MLVQTSLHLVVCYKDALDPTKWIHPTIAIELILCMLARHSNKRATWRWRLRSAPLGQQRNGTGGDREKSFETWTVRCLRGNLRTVYKAKRVSSVRSAFLWEPPGARAGWAGWAPGGGEAESVTLALSSRNLSNSAKTTSRGLISFGWQKEAVPHTAKQTYLHCSLLPLWYHPANGQKEDEKSHLFFITMINPS